MKSNVAIFLLLFFSGFIGANGQTSVIVNTDGTHSIAIHSGSFVTVVNPNGTHSVGTITGNVISVANSDGSFGIGVYNQLPKARDQVSSVNNEDSFYTNHSLNRTIQKYQHKLRWSQFKQKKERALKNRRIRR